MLLIKEGMNQNKKLTIIQWVKLLGQKNIIWEENELFLLPIQGAKKTVSALFELS